VAIAYNKCMGKLEGSAKKKLRRNQLRRIILGTIAAAGIIGVGLVAANVLGALAKMGLMKWPRRRRELINRARDRLLEQGLISRDEGGWIHLTERGRRLLYRLESANYHLKKPKKWDEKWRLLIFDIPEKRRGMREKIRRTLLAIGFKRLQDSVWVYPYDCEDLIAFLKTDFKVGRDLLYLIIEELEGDKTLREKFGLPKKIN